MSRDGYTVYGIQELVSEGFHDVGLGVAVGSVSLWSNHLRESAQQARGSFSFPSRPFAYSNALHSCYSHVAVRTATPG